MGMKDVTTLMQQERERKEAFQQQQAEERSQNRNAALAAYEEYQAMQAETPEPPSPAPYQLPGNPAGRTHGSEPILEDSRLKVEPPSRLVSSYLISFEAILHITKESAYEGAILLELPVASGELVEVWLPKKLCSNLDIDAQTVCVWDKFMDKKLAELDVHGGLAYEVAYYSDHAKDSEADSDAEGGA
jgi:hypothetical protein